MHIVVAIFLLLATTGLHVYTLETRSSPPECMDPNTQPELLVNTECASSLTSPSSCMQRRSYTGNCVAYCEQYLYWFFGPEVPFPDSDCEAYEQCTFAGEKSVAVTNSYSFDAGLSAKFPSKDLEVAFNVGASYMYSTTKTTSQTLTMTRPGNLTGNCGYWTFLPYYIQSCGFYISGTEDAGIHLIPVCSSAYEQIAFGCINTTYVDGNGNADGVTVFVAENCTTGERLPYDQQDVKYGGTNNNIPVLAVSQLTDSTSVASEINTTNVLAKPTGGDVLPDPVDVDTCNRVCICGYSPNKKQLLYYRARIDPAYLFCQCDVWLQNYLSAAVNEQPNKSAVPVTPADILLFDHYSVNYTGLVTTGDSTSAIPLQGSFECFGDEPLTVGTDVFQYVETEGSSGTLVGGGR